MPRHLVEVTRGFSSLRRGQRFLIDTDDPAHVRASKLIGRYLAVIETVEEVTDGTGGNRPAGNPELLPEMGEDPH